MTPHKTLLRIDASAQLDERSHTRKLTKQFIDSWQALRPQDRVIRRDVARQPMRRDR